MSETLTERLTPKPLTMDDMSRVVGALFLEVTMLRQQLQAVRAQLEAQDDRERQPR